MHNTAKPPKFNSKLHTEQAAAMTKINKFSINLFHFKWDPHYSEV